MKMGTKIWLWIALALCTGTTILNATQSRWLSVGIAIVAMVGLCLLLFGQRKIGFYLMCCCNLMSFIVGVYGGLQGTTGIFLSVLMSFIGSALIPVITFLVIRSQWADLR